MNPVLSVSETSPPGKRTGLLWLGRGCCALVLLGLVLRLTVRDHLPYLAAVFYALPLPVLLILAGMAVGLMRQQQRPRATRVWGLAALVIACWCIAATCRWQPSPADSPESTRILFWNTCRGLVGWERVAEFINSRQPDVAGLVEAGEWSEQRRAFWKQSCPGYHVSMLGGGFVCLTKEPAGAGVAVPLPAEGQYRQLDVQSSGQSVTLLIVDIPSNPLSSRRECLHQLAADADALGDRPVIIVGDFNTPSDSAHFHPLRRTHRHAFETGGRGYAATWPTPLPVLCLDQIWTNRHIEVLSCRHDWSVASDHRPVLAEIAILPAALKP